MQISKKNSLPFFFQQRIFDHATPTLTNDSSSSSSKFRFPISFCGWADIRHIGVHRTFVLRLSQTLFWMTAKLYNSRGRSLMLDFIDYDTRWWHHAFYSSFSYLSFPFPFPSVVKNGSSSSRQLSSFSSSQTVVGVRECDRFHHSPPPHRSQCWYHPDLYDAIKRNIYVRVYIEPSTCDIFQSGRSKGTTVGLLQRRWFVVYIAAPLSLSLSSRPRCELHIRLSLTKRRRRREGTISSITWKVNRVEFRIGLCVCVCVCVRLLSQKTRCAREFRARRSRLLAFMYIVTSYRRLDASATH